MNMSSHGQSELADDKSYEVEFFLLVDKLGRPGFTLEDLKRSMDDWRFPTELREAIEEIYDHPSADLIEVLDQASTAEEVLETDLESLR